MTNPKDDPSYHENKVMVEVAKKVGLDPSMITTLQVMGDGSEMVQITFEGHTTLSESVFKAILDKHTPQQDTNLNAWPEEDTRRCVESGEHQTTQRHPEAECPTTGTDEV